MNDYNMYLKMQEPIEFYDVCTIYQPTFGEILKYKMSNFEQLLIPYAITLDSFNVKLSDEEKGQITNFDLIVNYSDEILDVLGKSLEYFCKSTIRFDKDGFFFEGYTGRLNRNNWDEFAELILKICARQRPQTEKVPVFQNDRQKDIWNKLQEGRKRNAKNNELKLEDILNIVHLGGKLYISKEEIRNFTLWEIVNVYKSKISMSSYEDSFGIYLVSGEKSLIEGKHWTELIKLDCNPKE